MGHLSGFFCSPAKWFVHIDMFTCLNAFQNKFGLIHWLSNDDDSVTGFLLQHLAGMIIGLT
ncbi:hypothetical protein D3C75_1339200 [compost metagenome]